MGTEVAVAEIEIITESPPLQVAAVVKPQRSASVGMNGVQYRGYIVGMNGVQWV
jgi:hypothetical protein